MFADYIGLFLLMAGYVIGLGAVTVIDIHGFLGRRSNYWTEATTRTHKVTKPMIWVGLCLVLAGGVIFFRNDAFVGWPIYLLLMSGVLILNGVYLSFCVSPYLLKREAEGRSAELLPRTWQNRIVVSLIISDLFWWSSLGIIVFLIVSKWY